MDRDVGGWCSRGKGQGGVTRLVRPHSMAEEKSPAGTGERRGHPLDDPPSGVPRHMDVHGRRGGGGARPEGGERQMGPVCGSPDDGMPQPNLAL